MSQGCVYLVGAGPGDPGLITVRGRELLSQADIVVYDWLASPHLLGYARADAERIYVGKQAGAHTLAQQDINSLLVRLAGGGATVVRLKGGDPFVFGRGGEEALALADAGIRFEVVPGVTAAIAAAAYAGIPVTHRKLASGLQLITGHEAPGKEGTDLNFQALAHSKETLAFYMGVANLGAICEDLIANGLSDQTPAALIRWGTTPSQRAITGTVSSLPRLAKEADFKPPSIIVIGEVVRLRDRLKWFELRPLFGRRIVVTRARSQASELADTLEGLGAEVIQMPAIRIEPAADPEPLRRAVADLGSVDWVVFASVNSVDAFFSALAEAGLDSRALHAVKICVIGPATGERLGRHGLRADARPAQFVGTEIAAVLASQQDLAGARVLCPRPEAAPRALVDALAERGAVVREVVAYRSVPDGSGADRVTELLTENELNWITFASSSTVKNFFAAVDPESVRSRADTVRVASIGPATSGTLRQFGFEPDVQADPHTIEGLVEAVVSREETGETPR